MGINGFVYIIESPSKYDLQERREEVGLLSKAFVLAQIPHSYNLAYDKEMLFEAVNSRLIKACSDNHPRLPILHFSLHGNEDNVALTSGQSLSWNELRYLLLPLNRIIKGGLIGVRVVTEQKTEIRKNKPASHVYT